MGGCNGSRLYVVFMSVIKPSLVEQFIFKEAQDTTDLSFMAVGISTNQASS